MVRNYIDEYIMIYEKYNHNISEKYLKNNFPHIYTEINNFGVGYKWGERQYMYMENIHKRPLCPMCGNELGFINFTKGYKKFCSHACNVANNAIINTKSKHQRNTEYAGLDVMYKTTKDEYILENLCKHGTVGISKYMLDTIYNHKGYGHIKNNPLTICDKCYNEFVDTNNFSKSEIVEYIQTNNITDTSKYHIQYRERKLYAMIECFNKQNQYTWEQLIKIFFGNYCVDCGCETLYHRCDACKQKFVSKSISSNTSKHLKDKRQYKYKLINFDVNSGDTLDEYILSNVCKHGDIHIQKTTFNYVYNMYGSELNDSTHIICDHCLSEYNIEKNTNYSDCDIYGLQAKQIRYTYPLLYKYISEFVGNAHMTFAQKRFMFTEGIDELPKCKVCGENYVDIHKNNHSLLLTCSEHRYQLFRSNMEFELEEYIKSIYSGDVKISYRYEHNKEIDIFIPEFNLGIEMNGLYWHSEEKKDKNYHINKYKELQSIGISLITVWEDDWVSKRDIIKSIISNKLGRCQRIFARKCIIKEITNKEAKNFLNDNHIQGYIHASFSYGLFYNNEMVSLMTFSKPRMIMNSTNNKGYELLRFCNSKNKVIIGGASKLLAHFIKYESPSEIVSYANCDISNGGLYKKLGFDLISHTPPNYWWVVKNKREHRSKFMKHKLVEKGFDKNKTEVEIMHEQGAYRIFGNGNIKFILSNKN